MKKLNFSLIFFKDHIYKYIITTILCTCAKIREVLRINILSVLSRLTIGFKGENTNQAIHPMRIECNIWGPMRIRSIILGPIRKSKEEKLWGKEAQWD